MQEPGTALSHKPAARCHGGGGVGGLSIAGGYPIPYPPLDGAPILLPRAPPGSPAPWQGAFFPTWIPGKGMWEMIGAACVSLMGAELLGKNQSVSGSGRELCSALLFPCSDSPAQQGFLLLTPKSRDWCLKPLTCSWKSRHTHRSPWGGALGPLLQNQFFRDFWLGCKCNKWSLGWRRGPDGQGTLPMAGG